ncbi:MULTISPECIES: endonuclease/exonuclease/phosphatase family protein [Mesonia]|uniref:Uncharacterized protein n=1 Tax=Mesonia oceanica TaxID=2687242 RepID=A0AC61YBI7_9FLAO|nr:MULTISPECIES: endonuclease/exonuclease/phosphatase family protein [Mesonia]MAN29096.1 endonuclease [Mesonia sp.]MAQ41820.1 endonuclease [Mesonia sp.]MBJ98330.1 endonuclease [Flavobacteriaceae bacterium]VVV01764.1 hypothetical protein FVB9532_03058 [Mesonia oceanica]|tara:strand:+ start:30301 stop:31326 length:1026 start_codon:yes stop_codon:yes gene_type:complete
MKRLSIFNKIVFFFNSLFATALLFAYLLPYIPPSVFPFLSVLALGMPVLLLVNFIFLVYWLIKFKRQFLLSTFVLLLGLNHIFSLYKFSEAQEVTDKAEIKLMSYNVRQFNKYKWLEGDIAGEIIDFVKKEKVDIFCSQEYNMHDLVVFDEFKNHYIKESVQSKSIGQAIYTNYPIINKGSLDFQSGNNCIYADIKVKEDTLRIFNVHFESLKIIPEVKSLQKENKKKLINRVGASFRKQEEQVSLLKEKLAQTPYKSIICGDFNNSAFSYIYNELVDFGYKDAFKIAGNGTGKTFDFDFIPLRIDFFLVDKTIQVNEFNNYDVQLSDHYPISTTIHLPED